MAGHSKWNNIKQKKGKEDAKRAKIFTKMARAITVAAKEGGTDPEYNPALKLAIEKAKAENLPNDNVERAIKRASGLSEGENYENVVYEGYGPSGVAVIVIGLTDNKNRTAPEVRHAFDKNGGNLGQTGSVSFMFELKGVIVINKNGLDEEEIILDAIDAGAEDVNVGDDSFEIIIDKENFAKVVDKLSKKYKFKEADLNYIPLNLTTVTDKEDMKKLIKLFDLLEDNDDIQEVYHNWDIPEDLDLED